MIERPKKNVTSLLACAKKYLITLNNTPQASPVVHHCDAQTGGLLF